MYKNLSSKGSRRRVKRRALFSLCVDLSAMAVFCLLTSIAVVQPAVADDHQLIFLNWGDYMDPSLLASFEQQSGVKVKEVYFSSDDHRNALVAAADPGAYDVILVSGAQVDPYARRGWLAPIPNPQPSNLHYIETSWNERFSIASNHAVPFFWGTVGIAYRRDLLDRPLQSWAEFFDPHQGSRGDHAMVGSVRELVGLALKSLGYSYNSDNRAEIREAAAVLRAHDHRVSNYMYPQLDETSPLVTGEASAGIMYGGDTLLLKAHRPEIEYVLPREGGYLWLDLLAVSASSRRSDLAWKFIDFLCEPKNSAQLTSYLHTATTNRAARQFLPDSILQNRVIYPDQTALANSQMEKPISPRALNSMNSLVVPLLREEAP